LHALRGDSKPPIAIPIGECTREVAIGNKSPQPRPSELVSDIISDAEKLIQQQFDLLRSEVQEELQKVKEASLSLGAGVVVVGVGGTLSSLMLVHFLHRHTRIPLWCCYGLVGGLLQAGGYGLITSGTKKAANVHLAPPPQTTEALKENVAWLKDQVTPDTTAGKA
jgi:Putative Actinobacterial Holin-X, holin superfamily III